MFNIVLYYIQKIENNFYYFLISTIIAYIRSERRKIQKANINQVSWSNGQNNHLLYKSKMLMLHGYSCEGLKFNGHVSFHTVTSQRQALTILRQD